MERLGMVVGMQLTVLSLLDVKGEGSRGNRGGAEKALRRVSSLHQ